MQSPPRHPGWTVAYWTFLVLCWGAYCTLGYLYTGEEARTIPSVLYGYVAFWGLSILTSRLLHGVISRQRWLSLNPVQAVTRVSLALFVVIAVQAGFVPTFQFIMGNRWDGMWSLGFVGMLWVNIALTQGFVTLVYCVGSSLHRMRAAREQSEALQRNLDLSRLAALEAQMNPHFLFNALNSVRGMITENPAAAQEMVTRLANILRHALTRDVHTTIPLRSELEVAKDYLNLEEVRLEERLSVEIAVDPSVLDNPIPPLSLQTLVENAVKHGIAPLPAGGKVRIEAAPVDAAHWQIKVINSGTLHAEGPGTRLGLQNVRERLKLLFGTPDALQLVQSDSDQVTASLLLPTLRK